MFLNTSPMFKGLHSATSNSIGGLRKLIDQNIQDTFSTFGSTFAGNNSAGGQQPSLYSGPSQDVFGPRG